MLETNAKLRKLSVHNDKLYALTDADIRQIQTALLEMLKDFDAFCEKHGLRYVLCGGTALGAVRHKGFIPWDEDVDLAMPRVDYDRFEKLFAEEFGAVYHVQSIYSSEVYDLPFMKIRKKGTRFLELFEPEPEHAGIFIDIYPLENVPDFAPWRWFHGCISDFLHLCCSCVRMKVKKERYFAYYDDPAFLRIVKVKIFLGKCLGFFSLNRWCKIADSWASGCKNNKSKRVSFPGGRKHYFGELFSRQSALPPCKVAFEDITLAAMADPEEYLSALYGDYSVIPPVEKRERHMILEFDLGEMNG